MNANLSGQRIGHAFGDLRVLDDVGLAVEPGQTLALVGPSGCGKSTLLELVSGLNEPDSGTIEIGGSSEPAQRLRRCAYMPQTDCLLPWYSAIDNAGLALRNKGASRSEARDQAGQLFQQFGLAGFEKSSPAELSGGMRQRVAFLRTLLSGKPVLLLDEPFAALDAITRADLQEWLVPLLSTENRTAIMVTHDVEEALYIGDRVAVMSARPGRIIEVVDSPHQTAKGRSETVTAAEFTGLREEILALLIRESRAAEAHP